jgi:uncharacterized protein (DUF1778 family)
MPHRKGAQMSQAEKGPAQKARMNFRLDAEVKAKVARAAAITGQQLTDFAVSALNARAEEIIERHSSIVLNGKDYEFFLRTLADDNSHPSKKSLAAARRYKKGKRKGVRYTWS